MYEEGNRKLSINWLSLIVKLVVLAVVIFLLCWIFTRNKFNNNSTLAKADSEYINNINAMKSAALSYYTESNLPSKIGESKKLTLGKMVDQKLLIDFTNNGDKCNLDSSYIQATKTADGDYALKVNLECGNQKDFIVSNIEKVVCTTADCNNSNNNNNVTNPNYNDNEFNNRDDKDNFKPSTSTSTTNTSSSSSSSSNSNSKPIVNQTIVNITYKVTGYGTIVSHTGQDGAINGNNNNSNNNNVTNNTTNNNTTNNNTTNNTTNNNNNNNNTNNNNNSNNNNNTNNKPAVTKKTYYKHVKYGDWLDGKSTAANTENRQVSKTTYDYCLLRNQTIYSTSYTTNNNTHIYKYTLHLTNIKSNNVKSENIEIKNRSYFNNNSYTDYQNYIDSKKVPVIDMVNDNSKYHSKFASLEAYKESSLKSNNFTFTVGDIYKVGNDYYTDVTINVKNANSVKAYYDNNLKYSLYYVPIKFNLSYVDANCCIRDSKDNYSRYPGLIATDPKVEYSWQHRTLEYTWSTEKTLSGWTYTGISEER